MVISKEESCSILFIASTLCNYYTMDQFKFFYALLDAGIHHFQTGNIDYQLQLEVWKGNIGRALELAVEKRQLSDWLVGLSHLGQFITFI